MTGDRVETLRLPLSGVLYQRRLIDGAWRCITQAQHDAERSGSHRPGTRDWTSASQHIELGGRAQWAPGVHRGESWWLLYGDARDGPATVTLADGRTPPILTFRQLWICEWVSAWQPAEVTVGADAYPMFHRIPGYVQDLITGDE